MFVQITSHHPTAPILPHATGVSPRTADTLPHRRAHTLCSNTAAHPSSGGHAPSTDLQNVTESALVNYAERLATFAHDCGVATEFQSLGGPRVIVPEETVKKVLTALGHTVDTIEDIEASDTARIDAEWLRVLPPVVVSTYNRDWWLKTHVPDGAGITVTVTTEDGNTWPVGQVDHWVEPRVIDGITYGQASFALPTDLPIGWHTITATVTTDTTQDTHTCPLAVTPLRLDLVDQLDKGTGVMAQLYSVLSSRSWGIGDFGDLADLATIAGRNASADFLLINPLHAAEPTVPVEDSPYLPTTRRFINPIYLRITDIPEVGQADAETTALIREANEYYSATIAETESLNRNEVYGRKLDILKRLHTIPRTATREASYADFVAGEGEGLKDFATWCALCEVTESRVGGRLAEVLAELDADTAAAVAAATDFYMWLQWLCDEQLAAAQLAATDAGMSLGLMTDLAVGVHPIGADACMLHDVLAQGMEVGAPADDYSAQGQNWCQPPWHPTRLAEAAYQPWRDMLRTVLRHAGGIRVDHILGLFRLWWIPAGTPAKDGTYVHYDYEALLGILVLEAQRAGAVVIGEDLGTFEPYIQDKLKERGLLGTNILWFEHDGEGPRPAATYRTYAMSAVTTHDLPPTAGYLKGAHVALRAELDMLVRSEDEEFAADAQWHHEVATMLHEQGMLPTDPDAATAEEIVLAAHRHMAATPSLLTCTALVDMVGDERIQNQPGANAEMYPNWRVPLSDASGTPVLLDNLTEVPLFAKVAEAARRS